MLIVYLIDGTMKGMQIYKAPTQVSYLDPKLAWRIPDPWLAPANTQLHFYPNLSPESLVTRSLSVSTDGAPWGRDGAEL